MKVKRILRFYYSADGLERTIDGLIMKYACNFGGDGETDAERICALIDEKSELSLLWNYLDGIIGSLSEEERASLKTYAFMRGALKGQSVDIYNRIQRAAVKLSRRARRLGEFGKGIELINKYYCILSGGQPYLSGRK